jgi:hypothetical protein
MSEITNVFISQDRTKLAIELDDGDRAIVEFDIEHKSTVDLMTVPSDYIALGGGRSLGHGSSNHPTV